MFSLRRFVLCALALIATTAALRAGEPEMVPLPQRGAVLTVAFSPDGKRIATGAGKVVRHFDLSSGRETARLEASAKVGGIAFSPDGRRLAGVLDGDAVQLWDVSTAKTVSTTHSNYPADARAVAFTPDGRRIAAARESNVCYCDVVTGQQLGVTSFGGRVSLALSPDGKTLATGMGGNLVLLWDIEHYRELGSFEADPKAIVSAAFACDGKTLATAGTEKTIRLWDVATRKELRKIESTTEVRRLAFRPDGKALAVACGDKLVRLYDVASGKEGRRFGNAVGRINALAFSPDGSRLVTAGEEGVVVWDLTRDEKPLPKDFKPTAKDLDALWTDLGRDDMHRSYTALRTLRATPAYSVPFLTRYFAQRKAVVDEKKFAQLIAELDNDSFDMREKAMKNLENLGRAAEAAMRRALAGKRSADAKMRLRRLLDPFAGDPPPTAEQHRDLLAVRVLEGAGAPEARKLLESLVSESPDWWVVKEAKAALNRLNNQK